MDREKYNKIKYNISNFMTFSESFNKIPFNKKTTIHKITQIANNFEIGHQIMNISRNEYIKQPNSFNYGCNVIVRMKFPVLESFF